MKTGDLSTSDFINWMADRFVNVYGEDPNTDYILTARRHARECEIHVEGKTLTDAEVACLIQRVLASQK